MFTFNERLGMFFTVEASCLSIISVIAILCFVVYRRLRKTVLTWGKSNVLSPDTADSGLFLNLMLADLIQALGHLPTIRWMEEAEIAEGPLCTAQGAVKQVGIVGVTMTSLAIGIHTFSVLVLRWRAPRKTSKLVVLSVWIFTALVIGIPNAIRRHDVYYGDTGYWCWVVGKYQTEQLVTKYLWVWTSGFAMIILYGIMFAVMRGWFIIDHGVHWHKNYKSKHLNSEPETKEEETTKAIANLMLFYPAVYIFCVFPNSLSRWRTFTGAHTPYQATLFGDTLFNLSGMFNAILFATTRPHLVKGPSTVIESGEELLPYHHRKNSSSNQASTMLGRLPEREYTGDLPAGRQWADSGGPDFNPETLITDQGLRSSPTSSTLNTSFGHSSHVRKSSHPRERDDYRRFRESSSLIDKNEDFGHLTG